MLSHQKDQLSLFAKLRINNPKKTEAEVLKEEQSKEKGMFEDMLEKALETVKQEDKKSSSLTDSRVKSTKSIQLKKIHTSQKIAELDAKKAGLRYNPMIAKLL